MLLIVELRQTTHRLLIEHRVLQSGRAWTWLLLQDIYTFFLLTMTPYCCHFLLGLLLGPLDGYADHTERGVLLCLACHGTCACLSTTGVDTITDSADQTSHFYLSFALALIHSIPASAMPQCLELQTRRPIQAK